MKRSKPPGNLLTTFNDCVAKVASTQDYICLNSRYEEAKALLFPNYSAA